jgi:hypothetical protein
MRQLRTRATSTISLAAVTVTDRTCALVLGLEPRVFRELVAREQIPHAVVGRRIVCRVEDVISALHLDGSERSDREEAELAPRENRILAMLGRERVR